MSDNKQNIEPKFNEALAYEELRMIFVIAIETQDFQTLEARIAAWERKYPLEDFVDEEIVRRIKAILNRDFLQRLIGDYLTAKILHEQEKQKEAYTKLKEIIDTAKRTKDYSKAQKQILSWKSDLYSQDLYLPNFNKYYKAKICTMLLMPSQELEKQEEASKSLKDLVDRSKSMDSEQLSSEISDWQNKYTLADFPSKLQTELNGITTEVFESISIKTNQESALKELQEIASSDSLEPLDDISRVLAKYDLSKFDSDVIDEINTLTSEAAQLPVLNLNNPVIDAEEPLAFSTLSEVYAIYDLKNILSNNPHNFDGIINWIYLNRRMSFSEYARGELTNAFYAAGFRVPKQASYSIPEINEHLSYKEFSEIDKIRENVIINYIGLLSQGEKISSIGSENLANLNTQKKASEIAPSESIELVDDVGQEETPILQEEFSFALPVFDNEPPTPSVEEVKADELIEQPTENQEEEVIIQNIFTEDDLLQDPLETYTLSSSNSKEENNVDALVTETETPSQDSSSEPVTDNNDSIPSENQTSESELEEETIQEVAIQSEIPEVSQEKQELQEKPKESDSQESAKEPITETNAEIKPSSEVSEESHTEKVQTYEVHLESQESSNSLVHKEEPIAAKDIDDDAHVTINKDGSAKVISSKDDENIAKASELSTYIIVATPILEMALESRYVPRIKDSKSNEKDKDLQKNNGF